MSSKDKSLSISPVARSPVAPEFPIVGIGASAGGIEAMSELLRHLPPAPGIAIILVQHLDPKHPSLLSEIFSGATTMPVVQAVDGALMELNHVYVIPPNCALTLAASHLKLTSRETTDGLFMPIDILFRSLAQQCGRMGVAVVLSGGGTDGALGLQEVKAAEGITFVQDEATARHSSMPRSAEATACADFVLPPDQIARELVRLKNHRALAGNLEGTDGIIGEDTLALPRLFQLLRQRTSADFSQYKRPTIRRRIFRRMALHGIDKVEDYVSLLEQKPDEQDALYQDFLIRVTRFFRDPAAFDVLQSMIFPGMVRNRTAENPVRIWVAGCSTGEEVYSLAIALLEVMGDSINKTPVKILATDINETALEKARAGNYIDNIALDVSPDRLRRFFNQTNSHYQICKSVRDLCVFSSHNITRDTPFANLDLVSCRNLLIYLDLPLQKRVLPYFHYALKPGGCLLLGTSESTGSTSQLFDVVDKENRVFSKKVTSSRVSIEFPISERSLSPAPHLHVVTPETTEPATFNVEADRLLLSRYSPAAFLVDDEFKVIQARGNLTPFLISPAHQLPVSILSVIRVGLVGEVKAILERAQREQARVRSDCQYADNGELHTISLETIPFSSDKRSSSYLILFHDRKIPTVLSLSNPDDSGASTDSQFEQRLQHLERELTSTREHLQSVIEENEATNEELKAANEEILSSNEELQSTNEELQTAKEEMQSTNEELATVNDELKHRNSELNQLNDDLLNLFGGLDIPVVMVSRDLRIRRFTPPAEALFNLIPSDIGRRISDLRPNIDIPDFPKLIGEVIATVRSSERDVRDQNGRWYSLRVKPYITTENKIDGAAIAFVDIDALKKTAEDLAVSRNNAETIVETVWEPLLVLDQNLRVQRANAAFLRIFQVEQSSVEGRSFSELEANSWAQSTLLSELAKVIPTNTRLRDLELDGDFPELGRRTVLLNAHRIFWEGSGTQMILLAIEDITNRKKDQEQATILAREQAARAEAETQNRMKDEFLAMLAHELRNPLAPIRNAFYILKERFHGDPVVDEALGISDRQISHMSRLLDALLDIARITQGKIELRKELIRLQSVISRAIESSRFYTDSRGHRLDVQMPDAPIYLTADPSRLEQVFCNLLNNAAKYTDSGGEIRVAVEADGKFAVVTVSDNGMGISPELLPRVFDLFTQADRTIERSQGGLGLGLTLVKNLVSLHTGSVEVRSKGEGKGSSFTIRLPMVASEPQAEIKRIAAPKTSSVKGKRVLVVDDNKDSAKTLSILLSLSGHEVTLAHDGAEALATAMSIRPEVVFLDIGLPTMNGFEVARRMRDELQLTSTLIIALTGYGQEEDRRKSHEAGFDVHLIKPINPNDLDALLTRERA